VYIQPSSLIFQSQAVVNKASSNPASAGQATAFEMPIALDRGNQNTEKPYAIPIHKCIAKAAGGTSQRLKPALAMVCSFASKPYEFIASELLVPDIDRLLNFLVDGGYSKCIYSEPIRPLS
jgi:hypothetical protein